MTVSGKLVAPASVVLCHLFAQSAHAQDKTGSVIGIVFEASSSRSIPDATIEIPELARSVRSNARGAFSFEKLPPGEYAIKARAIGFAMFRATVRIPDQRQVEVPIALPRVLALDTVIISSVAREPLAFIEARALGLGSFVSYDLLSKSGARRLGDILTTVRSVGVIQGRSGRAYVYSKRKGPTLRQAPTSGERLKPESARGRRLLSRTGGGSDGDCPCLLCTRVSRPPVAQFGISRRAGQHQRLCRA